MKMEQMFSLTKGWLFWKSSIEGVENVRVSPRSYYAGQSFGIICGTASGFVMGVMFMALIIGLVN